MAATQTKPRHVKLADGSVIVFDRENNYYRLVHYKRRIRADGLPPISAAKFDDLVRRGILPRGYHTGWTRVVTLDKRLDDGIKELLKAAKSNLDAGEVHRYIRAMPWGRELP